MKDDDMLGNSQVVEDLEVRQLNVKEHGTQSNLDAQGHAIAL